MFILRIMVLLFAYSMTSHKNVKVRAEVQPPLQLPGLIIFVHGVNSEGEWYDYAERSLCAGLNQRLGLEGEHGLKENNYEGGFFVNSDKSEGGWEHTYEIEGSQKKWVSGPRKITKGGDGRSPVIRFYWGYRAADNETDTYAIPLKNKKGDNYYDLPRNRVKPKALGFGAAVRSRMAATNWSACGVKPGLITIHPCWGFRFRSVLRY
ncbi:hypothetical protein OH693_13045 [Escherichia coli]|nr:hypothetical protein [Escherichia coli]